MYGTENKDFFKMADEKSIKKSNKYKKKERRDIEKKKEKRKTKMNNKGEGKRSYERKKIEIVWIKNKEIK